MTDNQKIKTFQNPSEYWEHTGAFSVELVPGANKSNIPSSAKISGDTVFVSHGSIKQSVGAIQFYSDGSPFYWAYSCIKVIRGGRGNLLWVNYKYR